MMWLGTVATNLGQWMQNIALGWYMLVLTNSPLWVGLIGFAAGVPYLLITLPAGALIDRADERRVLMATQWAAMGTATLLAALILSGSAESWHLLVAAAINGAIMAVNGTVRQTFVPSLVPREHLANAVSLSSAGANAMRIIGPSIAGGIIGLFGVAICFIIQAFALAGALLATMRIEPVPNERGGIAPGGILDGFTEVRRKPAIGSLMLLTAIPATLVFPYIQLMPVFARDVFDIGAAGLGILMAASGVGALTGALVAATMDRVERKGLAVMILATVYCAAVAGFAASPGPILAMVGLFMAGITGSIFGSLSNALLLLLSNARVRGRVMGVYMLTSGFTPFGALALGAIAERAGTPKAVTGAALLAMVLVGLSTTRMKELRTT
ncbi:MAG TPA: MFS transporter [Thermomicrobiales bacterium]|nr:MFS transporter [Chloroflexota bacterium]HQZ90644.1 MFS transporter [Thermomicrobiales bacterium]